MMVRRGQADVIGIIGIMWMGKARVTGAESRRISDGVGGTTEMHMNGRHRVRARRRRANTRPCCTQTLLVPVPQCYCLVYLVVISVLEGPDDGPVNTSLGNFLLLLCIQPARLEGDTSMPILNCDHMGCADKLFPTLNHSLFFPSSVFIFTVESHFGRIPFVIHYMSQLYGLLLSTRAASLPGVLSLRRLYDR
jgi:hypothetical protein